MRTAGPREGDKKDFKWVGDDVQVWARIDRVAHWNRIRTGLKTLDIVCVSIQESHEDSMNLART